MRSAADQTPPPTPQGVDALCRVSKQLSDMGWQAYALAHGVIALSRIKVPRSLTLPDCDVCITTPHPLERAHWPSLTRVSLFRPPCRCDGEAKLHDNGGGTNKHH